MKLNITELVKGLGLRVIFLEMFCPNPLALVFPLILLWKLQSFSSCNMLGFFPLLFFNYFFYVVPYPTLSIAMLLKFWVNWKLLKNYFVELHSVLVTVMPPAANSGNCWRRDRSSSSVSSSKFTAAIWVILWFIFVIEKPDFIWEYHWYFSVGRVDYCVFVLGLSIEERLSCSVTSFSKEAAKT